MKTKTFMLTFTLLAILTSAVFAQSQEDMQKWMAYMKPGEMHQMLANSNGNWTEEITMWMAPNAPAQKSTATSENKMIMDGRYQESKTTGSFNGMPFNGYNLVGYDNARKVFQSTWIDNFGTGIIQMEGPYDPATKTVTFKGKETDPMSGNNMDVRETFQFVDDNTQVIDMFMTKDGQEFKSMEIKSTRKS